MSEIKNRYVHGTSAEKIQRVQYDVYEENKLLKAKKNAKSYRKLKLKMVVFIMAIALAFAFVTYRYAQITDLNYKVNKENISYNTLRNENQILKVDIKKATDLENIKSIAETKLGMQMPDKAQIVYVNVPERDFTNVPISNDNVKGNFLSVLMTKLSEFAGLLG